MTLRLISAFGLLVMLAIAWSLSENRKAISWRIVAWGLALQFAIALAVLKTPLRDAIFPQAEAAVNVLTDATLAGASFVFGKLPTDQGIGAIFAFQVLPVIIFVSALSAVLHHLRVIQTIVGVIAWLMQRTLKTSGAETFCAALQIFLGIEASTAVRAYIERMTRSELCVIMTTYMGTIAGSVMVVYSTFGAEAGHLLTASFMTAPAAILLAKILVPETEKPITAGGEKIQVPVETHNIVDAAAHGTAQGLQMALHVGATLIVFIGLVYLLDLIFQSITGTTFVDTLGYVFRPVAWLLGIPSQDVAEVAKLLGKKTVLNEFVSYLDLKVLIETNAISQRSITIATYALCSFANPGSIGITLAGLDAIAPSRRADVAKLCFKAFVGGALASLMTACIAGVILYE
ncbi:MAG TPA: nucleoside transporter C-terminal domain-containing protein [Candidatus Hydrogenedentes bacterium]|mgnify:FL=1|nr:nucleoside transporter C-terminal domain-containing protein [Candidatus Hydrogenedentota bacterium]